MKEAIRLILLYAHLIGFALLLGGAVTQWLTGKFRVNTAMVIGAATQVVTGLALAAPLRGEGHEPPTAKLIVKAVLGILIAGMVIPLRKREEISKGHFLGILGMVLGTAAVAVFWH
ncbi:hypothetical protein [Hamadaea tsunoensis]|uniref:hypothetical protein n=1 Tax=Hamadaea tsunoensis TaxID=53368 RepID=UPI0004200F9D|nr:hypothetical protein [Hamadaea tsunoensis]